MLNKTQDDFLVKRRKLIKAWNYLGIITLTVLIGFGTYICLKTPLLINPFEVLIRLEEETIQYPTLELMAVMLPIVFATAGFLVFVIVAMMYTVFSNERKYLEIIDELNKKP